MSNEVKKKGRISNEARYRYNKKTYKQFIFRLRYDTDQDLIEKLEASNSINATVREALEKYFEKIQKRG